MTFTVAQRLPPEDKAAIKRFVWATYQRSGARTWAEFARLAKVSESSLAEWRSDERGLPDAANVLRLLAAIGVIADDFSLLDASEQPSPARLQRARQAAVRLADAAEELNLLLAAAEE